MESRKIRVLMVDDEEQFRATTAKILTKRGYETTMAESGEEAIEKLKEKEFDVVILDIKMPGMDGNQALREIKTIQPDVQVIMLTGHGHIDSAIQALKDGAFDYLNKPCEIDLLVSRINSAYHLSTEKVKKEKLVRDIMIPIEDYTTIHEDSTVQDAINKLIESFGSLTSTSRLMETGHRSLLIFDDAGNVTGILTIRDLMEKLLPSYLTAPKPSMADTIQYSIMFWSGLFTTQVHNIKKMSVKTLMSPKPLTVKHDANLMEATYIMVSESKRRLAVVDDTGKIIGVVREQDIFFEIANILK